MVGGWDGWDVWWEVCIYTPTAGSMGRERHMGHNYNNRNFIIDGDYGGRAWSL